MNFVFDFLRDACEYLSKLGDRVTPLLTGGKLIAVLTAYALLLEKPLAIGLRRWVLGSIIATSAMMVYEDQRKQVAAQQLTIERQKLEIARLSAKCAPPQRHHSKAKRKGIHSKTSVSGLRRLKLRATLFFHGKKHEEAHPPSESGSRLGELSVEALYSSLTRLLTLPKRTTSGETQPSGFSNKSWTERPRFLVPHAAAGLDTGTLWEPNAPNRLPVESPH